MNTLSQDRASQKTDGKRRYVTAGLASMMGTTIEWYDFFLYGTAAALIFNKIFFPAFDPIVGTMAAFATYSVGFFARPLGGIVFGHFGDKVGRKSMLLITLMLMGVPTILIGLIPSYEQIGYWGAALLVSMRFLQGVAVGGEWGGAVLMAVEHAPEGKKGFFGSLPQVGVAPGLILSSLAMGAVAKLPEADMLSWGWRIPFLASAALVVVGLYVRLTIHETPVFRDAIERRERVKLPMKVVLREHPRQLVLGVMISLATFVLFYLMTVFALAWGTSALGYNRQQFLLVQLFGILFFALTIPISAVLADRHGRRRTLMLTTIAIAAFGFVFAPLLSAGTWGAMVSMALGLTLMGFTYGPLGTALSELFPTSVRYTGSSLTFNLAGIFGASLAPYAATWLARTYGLQYVGYYLTFAAALTLIGLIATRETKDDDLRR